MDIRDNIIEGWNLPICLCDIEADKDEEGCYCEGKIRISCDLDVEVVGFYMDQFSVNKRAFLPPVSLSNDDCWDKSNPNLIKFEFVLGGGGCFGRSGVGGKERWGGGQCGGQRHHKFGDVDL